jgi:hypothetical protein
MIGPTTEGTRGPGDAANRGSSQRAVGRTVARGFANLVGVVALLWCGLAAGLPGRAVAYPQWQLSTGAVRCTQCHFSPAGGGLLNGYGRDEMGDELATLGGNGALLNGSARVPGWLAVGADLRLAYVAQDVQDPSGAQQAFFPMQADLEARAAVSDFSLYATGGLRGQSRSNVDLVPDQNYQPQFASRFVSREHYLMWRPAALGPYARAGRFFAPFGLRLAEHVLYVRRDLGFNQLEESYNLSGGYSGEAGEAHLTVFFPDFLAHLGASTTGVAAYAERRVRDDSGVVGVQGKVETGNGSSRFIGGLIGKAFASTWKTIFFAEADLVRLTTSAGDSNQFVGVGGASLLAVKGLMVTGVGERRQTDLRVRDTATNGAALLVNWFPFAHVELEMMGRLQFPAGADAATKTFLAQLHYIL